MDNKRFNPEHADKLMSEDRKATLQPDKLIELLDVKQADIVADLGAGPGMIAIPLAQVTDHDVFAVDIEPDMLDMLKQNAKDAGVENLQYIVSDLEQINLKDQSVTRVINAFVAHEVGDIHQTIEEMKRILKPGGKLLLLDWAAVESESGPPLKIRIASEDMDQLLKTHGFSTTQHEVGAEHYAILAVKADE